MTSERNPTPAATAAAAGPLNRRDEMLRHVTELFIVGSDLHSDDQIALFDDIFARLVVEIELSARALLAIRLAPIAKAPPNIIRMLAFDDAIEVAGPVLSHSERLDEAALVENARVKSQQHLLAISRRRSLGEQVTDVLLERGDRHVVLSAAANRGARFSDDGFAVLVRRSEADDALAACVGARPELPEPLYLELLAKASQTVRARLEAEHPNAKRDVHQAVAEVTDRMRSAAAAAPAAPDAMSSDAMDLDAARAVVEALRGSGRLDDERLAAMANGGRLVETMTALAAMAELPLEFAERAMRHERPDTLLVLARAIGLSWPTVQAILSLRARGRGLPADEVAQSLASFERLKAETAKEIVQFYRRRQRPMSAQPRH